MEGQNIYIKNALKDVLLWTMWGKHIEFSDTCINYDPEIHEIILALNHLAYKT